MFSFVVDEVPNFLFTQAYDTSAYLSLIGKIKSKMLNHWFEAIIF